MGGTVSRYSGGVCCIFQRPFSRGIRGLLFQNLTMLIWIHISFSASRPFPSPSRASKLPESLNGFQRDSRYALYLDQFAVIRRHALLLHSIRSKCDGVFYVCLMSFLFNINCRALPNYIKLFQMICYTPAIHPAILNDLYIIAANRERF